MPLSTALDVLNSWYDKVNALKVALCDGLGTEISSTLLGDRQCLNVNVVATAASSLGPINEQDTFTAAGDTSAQITTDDVTNRAAKYWALSVTDLTPGSTTGWSVVLEASLDGVNFTPVITHNFADTTGKVKWSSGESPGISFRSRVVTLTGTSPSLLVTFYGV